jgi:hypothetical protein
MSAEHYDWLTAAARRSTRTADASQVVIDAVERAEMDTEHAARNELLKRAGQVALPEPKPALSSAAMISGPIKQQRDVICTNSRLRWSLILAWNVPRRLPRAIARNQR